MPILFPQRSFRRPRERNFGGLTAFGVDDQTFVSPGSGVSAVLARAGTRTVLDSNGAVGTVTHSQPAWGAAFNSTENVYEPGLELHGALTNLCLQSENLGTTWVAISTPTRTAAAKRCGDVQLDLVNDTSAAALQGYSQVITFTGATTKGVVVHLAAGTSTSSVIRLRDTTGAADRLLATIAWSGGVPTVTMTTGTRVGQVALANGVYRFYFQTTAVTPANTNQLELYPATTSGLAVANTGSAYLGGVLVENALYARGYAKTTTATVTTVADVFVDGQYWFQTPNSFTLYLRVARPIWMNVAAPSGATNKCMYLSLAPGVPRTFTLYHDLATNLITASLTDGTTPVTRTAALPATSMMDICVQCQNIATGGSLALDVGSGLSAFSSATGPIAFFDTSATNIGCGLSSTEQADTLIRRVIAVPGLRTMAQLKGMYV